MMAILRTLKSNSEQLRIKKKKEMTEIKSKA